EGYGETAQAVSLGLAVLRKCKQNSWDELVTAMAANDTVVIKAFKALDLEDEQLDVMSRRQPELGLIRIAPPVVPAVCPSCGMFILTSDQAPSKCQVTAGCEGKPAKVAAAKAVKVEPKPIEEVPAAEPASADPVPSRPVADVEVAVQALEAVTAELKAMAPTAEEAAEAQSVIDDFLFEAAAEPAPEPEAPKAEPVPVEDFDYVPPPPPEPVAVPDFGDDDDFN
ncbi:MAG TPA: hypothetical protein VF885_04970, partial [Arthrobacter sp.]